MFGTVEGGTSHSFCLSGMMNRPIPEYPVFAKANKNIHRKTKCKHDAWVQNKENKKREEKSQCNNERDWVAFASYNNINNPYIWNFTQH